MKEAKRHSRAASAALALAILFVPVFARAEAPQLCAKGQYVLEAGRTNSLRKKAVELFETASHRDVSIRGASRGTILVTENVAQASAPQKVRADVANRGCRQLRQLRRSALQKGRTTVNGILATRHVECSCNFELKAGLTPSDPYVPQLWGLLGEGSVNIDMQKAWDIETGDSNTVVAIIDTGIDYNHSDLSANIWTNPGEIPADGIDNDANGYVDDIHGMNAITNAGEMMDDHGHGTHVAGTIGALANNSTGVAGINWNIQMMGLKFLNSSGSGYLYDAVEAINYVTTMKQRGVNIVLSNNSWGGGGYSASLEAAIRANRDAGVLFVAAAGNSSQNITTYPAYPAAYSVENIIPVAATTQSGTLAYFSNYSPELVLIAAPGYQILSTARGDGYVYMSGTSMAAPHVSGALALLYSLDPTLSMLEYKQLLLDSAASLPSLDGIVNGSRFLNVASLLQLAQDDPHRPIPTPLPTGVPTATPTPRPPTPTPTPTATPSPIFIPGPRSFTVTIGGAAGPVAGALVKFDSGTIHAVGVTDSSGRIIFTNIMPTYGNYVITVTADGYELPPQTGFTWELNTRINLTVDSMQNVSGLVITSDKQPLAGVTVSAGRHGAAVTDSDGRFSLSIPRGSKYSLNAYIENYLIDSSLAMGTLYGDVERVLVAISE